jgi:TRAF3-interacting protein 1
MAENLDDLIAQARDKVSAIISRPKMTEKLLAKPPFRFLHDTVSSITAATGFANGLYNEGELDSAAITEKNAKMAYLDKIFACVGICKASLDSHETMKRFSYFFI